MIKKTISYTNVFGEDITETLYFNLTAAEIKALEEKYESQGGMSGRMKALAADDVTPREISDLFKELILESYGERVGNEFVKPDEAGRRNFLASEKFSLIYTRLVGEDVNGVSDNPFEFLVGIFPDKISKNVDLTEYNDEYNRLQASKGKAVEKQAEKTPSELARERSEANMRGHQQKKPAQQETSFPATDELEVKGSPETELDAELNAQARERAEFEEFQAWKASQRNA